MIGYELPAIAGMSSLISTGRPSKLGGSDAAEEFRHKY
jgi:hypothetical protein